MNLACVSRGSGALLIVLVCCMGVNLLSRVGSVLPVFLRLAGLCLFFAWC